MACCYCQFIGLKITVQTAGITAYACYIESDEEGIGYTTRTTEFVYENGTITTVETSEGITITEEDVCDTDFTSDEDPEFYYGALLSDSVTLSGPVSESAVLTAACAAVDLDAADPSEATTWLMSQLDWLSEYETPGWFGYATQTAGLTSGCTKIRFMFEQVGYTGLPLHLEWDWFDGDATYTPATPLDLDGTSAWIDVPANATMRNLKLSVVYA